MYSKVDYHDVRDFIMSVTESRHTIGAGAIAPIHSIAELSIRGSMLEEVAATTEMMHAKVFGQQENKIYTFPPAKYFQSDRFTRIGFTETELMLLQGIYELKQMTREELKDILEVFKLDLSYVCLTADIDTWKKQEGLSGVKICITTTGTKALNVQNYMLIIEMIRYLKKRNPTLNWSLTILLNENYSKEIFKFIKQTPNHIASLHKNILTEEEFTWESNLKYTNEVNLMKEIAKSLANRFDEYGMYEIGVIDDKLANLKESLPKCNMLELLNFHQIHNRRRLPSGTKDNNMFDSNNTMSREFASTGVANKE